MGRTPGSEGAQVEGRKAARGCGGGSEVREVKSAARTVALLELLTGRDDRPARPDELTTELGVLRSNTHQPSRPVWERGSEHRVDDFRACARAWARAHTVGV
jgi:hypothetical protein